MAIFISRIHYLEMIARYFLSLQAVISSIFEKCFWMGWETASYQRLINTARGVAIANCDTKPSSASGVFCAWSFERLMCWRPRFSPRITVTWQSRIPAAGGSWPEQRSEWYKFGRGIWCLQIRVTIAGCAPCTLYEIWIDRYQLPSFKNGQEVLELLLFTIVGSTDPFWPCHCGEHHHVQEPEADLAESHVNTCHILYILSYC